MLRAGWLSGGVASIRLVQLILLAVALTMSDPASFGEFGLASAILAIATYVSEGGLIQATTARTNLDEYEEGAAVSAALMLGAAAFVGQLAVAFAFAILLDLDRLVLYSALLGASTVTTAAASVSIGRLQRRGEFRALGLRQAAAGAVSLAVALGVVLAGQPILALVLQSLIAAVGYSLLVLFHPSCRIRPRSVRFADNDLRDSARRSLGSNLVGVVARRSDDLLIGAFLGPGAVGVYSLGYRVLTVVTEVVFHPLERVLLASASELRGDERPWDARTMATRYQARLGVLGIPLFALLAVCALFAVPVVFGEQWREAGVCAFWLCLAGAVQSCFWLTYPTLYALASPRAAMRYQIGLASALLGGVGVGIGWGVASAAFGYLAGSVVAGTWALIRWRRELAAPSHPDGLVTVR